MGITFDPTVSFGDIITVVGGIISLVWAYAKLEKRISMVELQVHTIWEGFIGRVRANDHAEE